MSKVAGVCSASGRSVEVLKRKGAAWQEIGARVASAIGRAAADDSESEEPAPLHGKKFPYVRVGSPALSHVAPSTAPGSRPLSELGDESDMGSVVSHCGFEALEVATRLNDVLSEADKWQEVSRRFAAVFREAALEDDEDSDWDN